jgi:hypothetical protein
MAEENAPSEAWADMVDDETELEPIVWPEDVVDPWKEEPAVAMFTEDSILLVDEPVELPWMIDSGATHDITPQRSLLREVRPYSCPSSLDLPTGIRP